MANGEVCGKTGILVTLCNCFTCKPSGVKLVTAVNGVKHYGYSGGTTHTHTGTNYVAKECKAKHTGEAIIEITPEVKVRAAAYNHISQTAFDEATILVPLNGSIPKSLWRFGHGKFIVQAELQDRGGVPADWLECVDYIISLAHKYPVMGWCLGSHGRTGTWLASMKARLDPACEDPIQWARDVHCKHAVESKKQAEAVFAILGKPLPAKYEDEFKVTFSGGSFDGWRKGWFLGKEYTHDIKTGPCPCDECVTERAGRTDADWTGPWTVRRTTPCQCTKYPFCEKDRAEYAEGKAEQAKKAAVVSTTVLRTLTGNEGKCRQDIAPDALASLGCFCVKCQATDIFPGPCLNTNLCGCRKCVLIFKLTERKEWDWLHMNTKHTGTCLCNSCWFVCPTHPDECPCDECIYLNLQPEEMEDAETASAAAHDIEIDAKETAGTEAGAISGYTLEVCDLCGQFIDACSCVQPALNKAGMA